jgi:putative spermidine/putrescine transport system permease protein
LLVFVAVTVLWPVAQFLYRAIDNRDIHGGLAATAATLTDWTPEQGAPGEASFAALVHDLANVSAGRQASALAGRINQALPGTRAMILKTARMVDDGIEPPVREKILAEAPAWERPEIWSLIKNDSGPLTGFYLLQSLDLERRADGTIAQVAPDKAIFLDVLGRTVWISLTVTLLCILLALPVAHVIDAASPRMKLILLGLVLFPLWTSLLVRTVAWTILLRGDGPANTALIWLGFTDEPLRLVYTRGSLIITMVQVLLPLMILPILSVLERVPKTYMRAAASLGATWWQAWRRVLFPLILPGILTGSAVVFIFALGYYITPALIGGPREQMLSSFIVFYTDKTLNWGLAAALSIQLMGLLVGSGLLIALTRKLVTSSA